MNTPSHHPSMVADIPGFWERVRKAPHRLLALDYDGTLAPFRIERMEARPIEGVLEILGEILQHRGTSLVIISGRSADEVLRLMDGLKVTIIGNHGSEVRLPDGTYRYSPPSHAQEKRLRQAEREAVRIAGSAHADRLERKCTSIAFHTRGIEPGEATSAERAIFRSWAEGADQLSLQCQHFNGGVELRCTGIDKGVAIRHVLEGMPEDTFCVYIGDDRTDEDAFNEIQQQGRGIGIRVGDHRQHTAAEGYLPNVDSVYHFLRGWVDVTINKQ